MCVIDITKNNMSLEDDGQPLWTLKVREVCLLRILVEQTLLESGLNI